MTKFTPDQMREMADCWANGEPVEPVDECLLVMADHIEKLEAENRHLRIMLDSHGRISTHKARRTKLREYIQTKTRRE